MPIAAEIAGSNRVAERNRIVYVSAATTLESYQRICYADTSGGAFTVNLPKANTMPGELVAIISKGSTNAVTVAAQTGDSLGPSGGNHAFEDSGDYAVYMAVAEGWIQVAINEAD